MLKELPGWLQEDPDVRAVVHCKAKEKERQFEMAAAIRDDAIPLRAGSRGLAWWEMYYNLPIEPDGLSVEQRRTLVLGKIKKEPPLGSGLSWKEQLTALIGGGWSHEEHPAESKVTVIVPFPPGSDPFEAAKALIPTLPSWPCHLELEVVSAEGFVLDLSTLDDEPFEAS